jgi:hypothetical protein
MNFFSKLRFSYIDVVVISVASIAFGKGDYMGTLVIFVVGRVLSLLVEAQWGK